MHQDFALLLPLTLDLVQSGLASFALPLLAMQHHPSVELEASERLLLLGLHPQAVAPEVSAHHPLVPLRLMQSELADLALQRLLLLRLLTVALAMFERLQPLPLHLVIAVLVMFVRQPLFVKRHLAGLRIDFVAVSYTHLTLPTNREV